MENTATLIEKLVNKETTHNQLSTAQLVEASIKRNEGKLTDKGALSVTTGKYTGRSPKDRFIVKDAKTENTVDWGEVNQSIESEVFDNLFKKVVDYLDEREELFIFNGYAGADEDTRLNIRVINEFAWHNLFAKDLFIEPATREEGLDIESEFTVVSAPTFKADPAVDGTKSETFIIVNFTERIVLIGGTEYGGEMKKSIFSVMNFLLPEQDVLAMHCSANVGKDGDVALFFGLSGTGKTTLSADPNRELIGDDEHGWNKKGVFNIEGGCYAKAIDLSAEKEPEIYGAIKFGTVLENVWLDETHSPDYTNKNLTENTRAAYPLKHIENALIPSKSGHAKTIIFLTADAFGVLPPISKLNKDQAMYHFLSGFTSKLAGTERGVTSPEPVFSTCFGAPFLPLHASVYANKLGELIDEHNVNVFLVNTGWTGGEYGVGERMNLKHTRSMVTEAISGNLENGEFVTDETFGLQIPTSVKDVPSEVLNPRETWANKDAYDNIANKLIESFRDNFKKFGDDSQAFAEKGGF
ncbi:phosphoenolpyruvate carboxykinase (ATP) [Phocicoccus pinnipedialis]|uniref:Phosphoenolpyruvate carboxykinase (ATP) n=1 Tax=Phocicoccus pinnipedialis TaxID=110845 RepID=A0A6V7RCD8_9BACL|nr:phosphoenolpyruvate carboxykinase (ATP) [Jeotgalicoccus pinnipedialis]MBP1939571.1 phosphoenolpyruvate carboxykinase (ATP) [Jeotgalicoccus pinnipedialis]CAD2074929.1 Phosphoenolpyruvate carboxykinase [ATP] [Jeotgalicoccus pinnipedialis]